MNGVSNSENTNSTPDENESREFCKKIWGINKIHNKDAEWLSNIKFELLNLDREEDLIISKRKILQKLPNWKAPGKDRLQGYWIKAFKSLHDWLLNFLNLRLQSGKTQNAMSVERLYLFRKILAKVPVVDPVEKSPG